MDLPVVPLHKYPQYAKQCCQLINDEWKRSISARMRSLESSRDNLPTSLILLKGAKVIGHCKLSPIPTMRNACFMEIVVIDKPLRGKGYGRYLMTKAEQYSKDTVKLRTIYLATKGQELFYSKLGYERCEPISIYGSLTTVNTSKQHVQNDSGKTGNESKGPIPPPMPKITNYRAQNIQVFMKKEL